jgi:hypothetical protein
MNVIPRNSWLCMDNFFDEFLSHRQLTNDDSFLNLGLILLIKTISLYL